MNAALRTLPSDRSLRWFVLASVLLHVLTAFLSDSLSQTKPKQRQVIEIALAPAKGNPALEKLAPPAPPTKKPAVAAPPPAVTPPPPAPVAEKPKPPPKPVADKPSKPAVKPTPKTDPLPPKLSEKTATPADNPAAPANASNMLAELRKMLEAKKQQEVGAGVADGSGYALPTNVKGRLYFSQLQAAVTAAWTVPPGTRRKAVEIEILIGSTGKLLQRTIRLPSGDALFDRSAIAALDRANIPPPPPEFRTPLRMILHMVPPEE